MATQASENFVQQLYVAYYGRPAESEGLQYWADRADDEGQDAIINAFGESQEYQDNFGDLSNANLVNNLYQQLFGRDADPDGLAYYTGVLDAEEKSLAEIAVTISNAAQGSDKQTFDAKVDAAAEYTAEYGAAEDYNLEAAKAVVADTDGGVYQPTLTDAIADLESAEQAQADFLAEVDGDDDSETSADESEVEQALTDAQDALNGVFSQNQLNANLADAQDQLEDANDAIAETAGLRKAIADYQAAQVAAGNAQEAAGDADAELSGAETTFAAKNDGGTLVVNDDGTATFNGNNIFVTEDGELTVDEEATADLEDVDALFADVQANLEAQENLAEANTAVTDANNEVSDRNGQDELTNLDVAKTAVSDAETALEERAELQTAVDEAQANVDQLDSLNGDIDEATAAITDSEADGGLGISLNETNTATAENDLFIFSEDNETSIGSFGEAGEDLFYVGNDFTRVDLKDGVDLTASAQGSASAQEIFFQDVSGGVALSFESKAFQGSATNSFEGDVITLTGVTSDELQLENGYISVA